MQTNSTRHPSAGLFGGTSVPVNIQHPLELRKRKTQPTTSVSLCSLGNVDTLLCQGNCSRRVLCPRHLSSHFHAKGLVFFPSKYRHLLPPASASLPLLNAHAMMLQQTNPNVPSRRLEESHCLCSGLPRELDRASGTQPRVCFC